LTIGLTAGGHRYPWLSAPVLAALVVAVLAAVAFARHEARVSEPLLSLELLRREPVIASMLSMALAAMVMFGSISYLPLFAQGVLGSSATSSGLVLAPLLVADLLASFLTGQWIARSGRLRPNALLGAVVVCFGLVLCTRMTTASTTADVAHAMMIVGFGLGMMMQVYGMSVQNVAADHEIGSATALTEFSRVVGATLGVTVMGAILNQGLPPGLESLGGAHPGATDVDPAVRATLAHALEPAFVALLCAGLLLFLVILTRLREIPLRRSAPANRYVERA
jgi:predicted MFS family arabinose efflux permease